MNYTKLESIFIVVLEMVLAVAKNTKKLLGMLKKKSAKIKTE